MVALLKRIAHHSAGRYRELKLVAELARPSHRFATSDNSKRDVVVALTSYPGRIRHAWRSIETLLRQEDRHDMTLLVLAEEDFPLRELPPQLRRQQHRGLEILWTKRNGRSFDKLLPVLSTFPSSRVITVDDDLYFPGNLVRELVLCSDDFPGWLVGARGWRVLPSSSDGRVHFAIDWERAKPGDAGRGLHLPGGNGTLYPPGALDPVVEDLDLALTLAPTHDDIWFWIQAVRAGTKSVCLGMPPHRKVTAQTRTPALSQVNWVSQEKQFQAVLKHFRLEPTELVWE